ncbi:HD domain-containing protein [candidate division KSB1 bacterium]|nr:HD domain-containing protein [candidate division KSB1 bacterium]
MENPHPDSLYHSRLQPRKPDLRGDYFRDQTAIVHATPFRRLKHKTQVFFAPQNDHICTRIEHVLHVSTIATTICKGLGLDVELAQAISLGHDLGHAPFGHVGEKILNALSQSIGGFIHEVHGLRVVDKLARDGKGLNLTYAVRDGIVSHCGENFEQFIKPEEIEKDLTLIDQRQNAPLTYEGCVVRVSDKIAYLGRDIEDAIAAGLITSSDIPDRLRKSLGKTNGEIIDTLVMDVVQKSVNQDVIAMSDEKFELICELKDFNYSHIYHNDRLMKNDDSITNLLTRLYNHLIDRFLANGFDIKAYTSAEPIVDRHFGLSLKKRVHLYENDPKPERCVVDFIAGMTDSYALEAVDDLVFPKPIGLL